LLLADEPTGELDSATADEVFQVFRHLNQDTGVTIVVVTHDREITARVDRVVSMRDGRTSTELVRYVQFSLGAGETIEEFAVVDNSGRLQISREYLDRLGIERRARVGYVDGHVEVHPEHEPDQAKPPWKRR
jgi:energy-coupling factor transporter ATP-binding protein EcfA2